jgi:hypothetical protein
MSDDDPPPAAPTSAATLATVSVKLPPFWPSDPEIWFAQVEATFTTRRITSERTRFDYVIAYLSPEVATEIRDLILKPPEATPYKILKEQLIRRTAASEQRRLQQLFNAEELGDRKPTQLLRRMQQLLGDRASTTDSTFLRELFLQRLPSNVRMVLASTKATATLEELAELADKVVEVAAPTVAATSVSSSPEILAEIEQLRSTVQQLQTSVRQLTRQSRGRSHSRSRQHSPAPQEQTTCWYHHKYGSKAKKCTPPCNFTQPSNDQASR